MEDGAAARLAQYVMQKSMAHPTKKKTFFRQTLDYSLVPEAEVVERALAAADPKERAIMLPLERQLPGFVV